MVPLVQNWIMSDDCDLKVVDNLPRRNMVTVEIVDNCPVIENG